MNKQALSTKRPTSVRRPRFAIVKRCAMNVLAHPKAHSVRSPQRQLLAQRLASQRPVPYGSESFKALDWKAEAPVSQSYGALLVQRQALRHQYGLRLSSTLRRFSDSWRRGWHKRVARLRAASSGSSTVASLSPLEPLELRADVVLHRSGLANTVAQARQWIGHGHVHLGSVSSTLRSSSVAARSWKPLSSGTMLEPGTRRRIDAAFWQRNQATVVAQWQRWDAVTVRVAPTVTGSESAGANEPVVSGEAAVVHESVGDGATADGTVTDVQAAATAVGRNVPSYREVDYSSGCVVIVDRPYRRETLMPSALTPNADVLAVR